MEGTTPKSGFFTPLENTKPYFKAAFQGFAGSGKTFTSGQIAIGLHKRIGSTKPIVIFDTETAAKFLKEQFAKAGIQALVKESRSLADLKETMRIMREEKLSDILIIDSISHIWENYLQSYAEKVRRTRLEFQDWGVIKPTWKREFSDPFVRDPYHVIMTGRAGDVYESEINRETGKREIHKTGEMKMKVEGETAYEPDLLVEMELIQEMHGDSKVLFNQAFVKKDRSTKIMGKIFKTPKFEDFAPAIDVMLADPSNRSSVAERDSKELFKTEEDKAEWRRQKTMVLEEIEGYLVQVKPGQDAASKKFKVDAIEAAFGTRSWTAVEQMSIESLHDGFFKLQDFVKNATEIERRELEAEEAAKAKKAKKE